MGFGLCFVGFLALMLDSVGLDGVGYALIAVGFLKVSKELTGYKGYRIASVCAFAAIPVAALSMYSFITVLTDAPQLPETVLKIKSVYLCVMGAAVCMAHCQSTANVARLGGAKVFAFRATATLYVSALYFAGSIAGALFGAPGGVAAVLFACKFLVPLLNALLLFTCFTTVTTKARAVEEERIIKQQTEILKRKQALKRQKDTEDK